MTAYTWLKALYRPKPHTQVRQPDCLARCGIGFLATTNPFRLTNGFYIKLLSFNLWVYHGDSMQVGKRNPLGTVTFTGIDFAANRQTRIVALL